MKKLLGIILAAAFLAAPLAGLARAESVDFSKVTCGEFVGLDQDDLTVFYFWLDGYLSAKSGNTVLNLDGVQSDMEELFKLCQANPRTPVLKALGQ